MQPSFRFLRVLPLLAAIYMVGLTGILLFPFNFSAPNSANSVTWRADGEGVDFGTSGMLVSKEPPAQIFRQLT